MITHKGKICFTKDEVQQLFAVTHMTVYNWRLGNGQKTKLPMVEVPRGEGASTRLVIAPKALTAWAKHNGVSFDEKALQKLVDKTEASIQKEKDRARAKADRAQSTAVQTA